LHGPGNKDEHIKARKVGKKDPPQIRTNAKGRKNPPGGQANTGKKWVEKVGFKNLERAGGVVRPRRGGSRTKEGHSPSLSGFRKRWRTEVDTPEKKRGSPGFRKETDSGYWYNL